MITIENLSYHYQGRETPALFDLNLHVEKGSLMGLLGPNGAGKSTLLSILSGLLELQKGKVSLNQLDLRQALKQKNFLAMVPQDFAFYPQLTAWENLSFFARILGLNNKECNKEVERCIALTQLEHYVHYRAASYSGGLKRRLNLAIALLSNPKLLFLDEPTVGVDAQSRHFLLESIRELNRQGVTIVYTSHYLEEVQQLCDSLAIIDYGKIQLQGQMQDLLNQKKRIEIVLSQALSEEQQKLLHEQVETEFQYDEKKQVLYFYQNNSALLAILSLLERLAIHYSGVNSSAQQTLESIYLDLTERRIRD